MPLKSWNDLLTEAGDSGNFEPLPEGDYDFVITKSEAKQAQSGKTMYVATCEVQGGPHNKRKVWHNFVITPDNPNALGFFFRNMKTLGLTGDFFQANPSDSQVAEAMQGRAFRGHVAIRKWQGQDKNEIKSFYPAGQAVSASAPPPPAAPGAPAPTYAAPPPSVAAAPPPPAPAPPAAPPPTQPEVPPAPVEVVAPVVAETPAPAPAPAAEAAPAQQNAAATPPPPPPF